jgi:hypothetical protein
MYKQQLTAGKGLRFLKVDDPEPVKIITVEIILIRLSLQLAVININSSFSDIYKDWFLQRAAFFRQNG